MDNTVLEGLMRGDPETIARVDGIISDLSSEDSQEGSRHQAEITKIWKVVVMGMHNATITGDDAVRSRLMDFALRFSKLRQDEETRLLYGDLAVMYGAPNSPQASIFTMRTAATIAKMVRNDVPGAEEYLMLAKEALIVMLENGEFENRLVAATGLAWLIYRDPDVRERLITMAQQGANDELREAAGESIALMRNTIELNLAIADRDLFLGVEYPDPNDARRECLEQMLDAARTVLEANGRDQGEDYEVAVRQLVVFSAKPEDITICFYGKRDRRVLERMMMHAENALLKVLVRAKDEGVREEAAIGLESIASDRVEAILERIVDRLGDDCKVGGLASETLQRIRGKKLQMFDVKPLPPPKPKKHTDPEKVLSVKL